MASRRLFGVETLGCVLRADIAFERYVEERIALPEQRDMVDAQAAAHGVDEDEPALFAGAVLEALLPFGRRQGSKLFVDFLGRLGARVGCAEQCREDRKYRYR